MTTQPYAKYVEGLDALHCLQETPTRIESLVRAWPRSRDEQTYAPGKWTARQILVHLAQIEMVFTIRLRFALASDGYVVQPFEQDDWLKIESPVSALDALEAYVAMRKMNLQLCRGLSPQQRTRVLTHPEYGAIDVEWLIGWCAGHERNHLPQIETIAKA